MRALYSKIKPITSGGIPGQVRKINECIEAINHLFGMRSINGQPISDGPTGPIIDLGQITQPPGPWTVDPFGNPAGWIVCSGFNFWGTGSCPPAGCANFLTSSHTTVTGTPCVVTFHPTRLITSPPPTVTPVVYLAATNQSGNPVFNISTAASSGTFNYTFTVTYDGTTILNVSGSVTVSGSIGTIVLSPTGWTLDPSGLAGYSHGNGQQIFEYNGPASSNTNPAVVETLSVTPSDSGLNIVSIPVTYLQN